MMSRQVSIKIFIILLILFICIIPYFNHVFNQYNYFSNVYEKCNCKRNIPLRADNKIPLSATTCGIDAWRRGIGQKVIGFSFYHNKEYKSFNAKGYIEGIRGNIEIMDKFYPGWIMRLYYDLEPSDPVMDEVCQLVCQYSNLDICDIQNLPGHPVKNASDIFAMFWRFFPTMDPQVDLYASRDLDSRFSEREVEAVNEFIKSEKIIHAMRDHPGHGIPLIGASWGSNLSLDKARKFWQHTWEDIFNDTLTYTSRKIKGPDQTIINRYVWPWGKNNAMQHDSYHCHKFPGSVGWPTQRKIEPSNYVSAVTKYNATTLKICPVQCRRNPSWEYC